MGRPVLWTEDRLNRRDELAYAGVPEIAIAAQLKTTRRAIRSAVYRHGFTPQTHATYTRKRIAQLFGVKPCVVHHWITRGYLPNHRANGAPQSRGAYIVPESALHAFVENRRTWALWTPDAITDRAWREWATELRSRDPLLSSAEIAERFCVGRSTVCLWFRTGRLPGFIDCDGRGYYALRSSVEAFTPPNMLPRFTRLPRRFTDAERDAVVELRETGATYVAIGQALGRGHTAVMWEWRRLQARGYRPLFERIERKRRAEGLRQTDVAAIAGMPLYRWSLIRHRKKPLAAGARTRLEAWLAASTAEAAS